MCWASQGSSAFLFGVMLLLGILLREVYAKGPGMGREQELCSARR